VKTTGFGAGATVLSRADRTNHEHRVEMFPSGREPCVRIPLQVCGRAGHRMEGHVMTEVRHIPHEVVEIRVHLIHGTKLD